MTSARREGDDYIINGAKRYITNAPPRAGVFTVMARTGRKEDGGRGVSAFLVDADLPGISWANPIRKWDRREPIPAM